MTVRRENEELRILSAIGIILVAAGHLGYNLFDLGGLFPYYSFHIFLFLFVSGYFYRPEAEQKIGRYLARKFLALMGPYFLWNLVYGILAALLRRAGFSIGQELSLYTLFLAPFDGGHQFMYHFPSWFVPALFLIEIINVCMRKALSVFRLNREWLIFAGTLLLGIVTVWLAIGGHVWGFYKIPGRLLFMLPGYELGHLYREKLEKRDTLPDGLYFLLVIGVQILVSLFCGGLAFSAVWVTSFGNGPVIPYLTVLTGTAFWLRIARLLASNRSGRDGGIAGWLLVVGRNTYAIMMHHIFAFFLVKSLFYAVSVLTPLCAEFDAAMYFSEINFIYLPKGAEVGKWIYLFAGIQIPLLIGKASKMLAGAACRLRVSDNFRKIK